MSEQERINGEIYPSEPAEATDAGARQRTADAWIARNHAANTEQIRRENGASASDEEEPEHLSTDTTPANTLRGYEHGGQGETGFTPDGHIPGLVEETDEQVTERRNRWIADCGGLDDLCNVATLAYLTAEDGASVAALDMPDDFKKCLEWLISMGARLEGVSE